METIRMDRTVVSKSTFEEADDHVTFYKNKTPLERLNYACDIINSNFNTSSEKKQTVLLFHQENMTNLFNIDFQEFLELLNSHKVDYLLVGGYAVILHGYGRSTGDMGLQNFRKLR